MPSAAPSAAGPQSLQEEDAVDELLQLAAELQVDLDEAGALATFRRCGHDLNRAKRRLKKRRSSIERAALAIHDERVEHKASTDTAEKTTAVKLVSSSERLQRRAGLPLLERLAEALAAAGRLPSIATGDSVGGSSGGHHPKSAPPPHASTEIAEHYLGLLQRLTLAVEAETDAALYGGGESLEQRDRRLVGQWAGHPSHVVATIDHSHLSVSSIERIRADAGFTRALGLPVDDAETAAVHEAVDEYEARPVDVTAWEPTHDPRPGGPARRVVIDEGR